MDIDINKYCTVPVKLFESNDPVNKFQTLKLILITQSQNIKDNVMYAYFYVLFIFVTYLWDLSVKRNSIDFGAYEIKTQKPDSHI